MPAPPWRSTRTWPSAASSTPRQLPVEGRGGKGVFPTAADVGGGTPRRRPPRSDRPPRSPPPSPRSLTAEELRPAGGDALRQPLRGLRHVAGLPAECHPAASARRKDPRRRRGCPRAACPAGARQRQPAARTPGHVRGAGLAATAGLRPGRSGRHLGPRRTDPLAPGGGGGWGKGGLRVPCERLFYG